MDHEVPQGTFCGQGFPSGDPDLSICSDLSSEVDSGECWLLCWMSLTQWRWWNWYSHPPSWYRFSHTPLMEFLQSLFLSLVFKNSMVQFAEGGTSTANMMLNFLLCGCLLRQMSAKVWEVVKIFKHFSNYSDCQGVNYTAWGILEEHVGFPDVKLSPCSLLPPLQLLRKLISSCAWSTLEDWSVCLHC